MSGCLAIIPARGGSKRIPRKNIKSFCGKPIIEYSIDVALKSGCFDEVMVSTDDKEIAEVAEKCGAIVPFMRSQNASNDYATIADVIEEILDKYNRDGRTFEYFCCIFSTAPFISVEKLKQGFELLKKQSADSVVPVVQFGYPIQRSLKMENDRLKMFWPENCNVRSQDLETAYHDCGQWYWMNTKSFLEQKKLFANFTVPLEISEFEAQDIDTEEDWKIAELKYKFLNNMI